MLSCVGPRDVAVAARPFPGERAGRVERDHPMVARVGHEHAAVRVDLEHGRIGESARAVARRAGDPEGDGRPRRPARRRRCGAGWRRRRTGDHAGPRRPRGLRRARPARGTSSTGGCRGGRGDGGRRASTCRRRTIRRRGSGSRWDRPAAPRGFPAAGRRAGPGSRSAFAAPRERGGFLRGRRPGSGRSRGPGSPPRPSMVTEPSASDSHSRTRRSWSRRSTRSVAPSGTTT